MTEVSFFVVVFFLLSHKGIGIVTQVPENHPKIFRTSKGGGPHEKNFTFSLGSKAYLKA